VTFRTRMRSAGRYLKSRKINDLWAGAIGDRGSTQSGTEGGPRRLYPCFEGSADLSPFGGLSGLPFVPFPGFQ